MTVRLRRVGACAARGRLCRRCNPKLSGRPATKGRREADKIASRSSQPPFTERNQRDVRCETCGSSGCPRSMGGGL